MPINNRQIPVGRVAPIGRVLSGVYTVPAIFQPSNAWIYCDMVPCDTNNQPIQIPTPDHRILNYGQLTDRLGVRCEYLQKTGNSSVSPQGFIGHALSNTYISYPDQSFVASSTPYTYIALSRILSVDFDSHNVGYSVKAYPLCFAKASNPLDFLSGMMLQYGGFRKGITLFDGVSRSTAVSDLQTPLEVLGFYSVSSGGGTLMKYYSNGIIETPKTGSVGNSGLLGTTDNGSWRIQHVNPLDYADNYGKNRFVQYFSGCFSGQATDTELRQFESYLRAQYTLNKPFLDP